MPLLPLHRPVEERFYLYQKKTKASLLRQRSLTQYLQNISPAGVRFLKGDCKTHS